MTQTYPRFLVTGGAGFVGSAAVRDILRRFPAATVAVVDSLFNGRQENLPDSDRVTLIDADLRDADELSRIIEQVSAEYVVHLAAIHFIPYCNAHPGETLDINVTGTQNLLDALRRRPPRSLVIASTAAVYPIHDGPNSETFPLPAPTDIYGLSKWMNEKQLELFAQTVDTRCAAARLFNVYGPRETNPHVLPEIVNQLLAGQLTISLGNVSPKRDYVFTSDVASALSLLVHSNRQSFEVCNVGTGSEYSVSDLVDRLSSLAQRPLEIVSDPARVRKSDRPHLLCDHSRLTQLTGWQPEYNIDQGLSALWDWSCEHRERLLAVAAT
jgi:UDP-glucose 4-epimerase